MLYLQRLISVVVIYMHCFKSEITAGLFHTFVCVLSKWNCGCTSELVFMFKMLLQLMLRSLICCIINLSMFLIVS